ARDLRRSSCPRLARVRHQLAHLERALPGGRSGPPRRVRLTELLALLEANRGGAGLARAHRYGAGLGAELAVLEDHGVGTRRHLHARDWCAAVGASVDDDLRRRDGVGVD